MKKIVIVLSAICLISVLGYFLWSNRTVATITLDINPSIKINLKKNNKVKSIVALNDDAKDIISIDVRGKSLDATLKSITNRLVEKEYVRDGTIVILIYSEGNVNTHEVEIKMHDEFMENNVNPQILIIENVTKEDEKLAKKYDITPAKAAYINMIKSNNDDISIEDLIDKPVGELKETVDTGRYCEKDYNFEGDFCFKKLGEEAAVKGEICPVGYHDYNGKCYEEGESTETDKLVCPDNEFKLDGKTCSKTRVMEAEATKYYCSKGEAKTRSELGLTGADDGDANKIVCVDYSSATHPVTPCELPANDPTERMSAGGKCYWHRAPVIAEGCPGKIQVGGECWDDASNIYICAGYRDGKQYSSKSEYCEHSIKYIEPTVTEYKCREEGYTLKGSKCEKEEVTDAYYERICATNYSMSTTGRCINYNKTANKQEGYVCTNESSKLVGNTCFIYDIIEAKGR